MYFKYSILYLIDYSLSIRSIESLNQFIDFNLSRYTCVEQEQQIYIYIHIYIYTYIDIWIQLQYGCSCSQPKWRFKTNKYENILGRNVCRQTYIISISNNMVFWCIWNGPRKESFYDKLHELRVAHFRTNQNQLRHSDTVAVALCFLESLGCKQFWSSKHQPRMDPTS